MAKPPLIQSNPFHDLNADEAAAIFAQQAADAQAAQSYADSEWRSRKRLKLHGPTLFVVVLVSVLVVTLPFWMIPALSGYKLGVLLLVVPVWLWRLVDRRIRKPQREA
jgi:hypothetical protein